MASVPANDTLVEKIEDIQKEQEVFNFKCKELKRKITTVEESNKLAALAILRTKNNINRLRLEYSILLERLESKIVLPNENDNDNDENDLSDGEIDFVIDRKNQKKRVVAERDPSLPKRPLNPYLIFCEMEREKLRKQADGKVIDLSKSLTEAWKKLDDDAKQTYVEKYNNYREQYQKDMDVYEKGNNTKKQKSHASSEIKQEDEKTQSPEPETN